MNEVARINKVKAECHKLMEIIWGKSRVGRTKAYFWVSHETGVRHFSQESDYGKLFTTRTKLYKLGLEGRYFTEEDLPFIFKT